MGYISFSGKRTSERTLKILMTKLLFGQETWLIGVFVCSFVFIWRIEGCLVEITSNNLFCAVCVPCTCFISLANPWRRSWLFHACLQVLALEVAWILKRKVSYLESMLAKIMHLKSLFLPDMPQNVSFSQMHNSLQAADCTGCKSCHRTMPLVTIAAV